MKNKKAIGSVVIPVFFTIIMVIMLIVIITFTSSKIEEKKNKVYETEMVHIESQRDMLRYLNSPVKYEGNELTIKDLIVIDYYNYLNSKNKDEFKNLKVKNFLESRSTTADYRFTIRTTNNNKFVQIYSVKSDNFPRESIVELFSTTLLFANDYLVISYEESYDE